MTNPQTHKQKLAEHKSQIKTPSTKASQFRETLKTLETRVAKLSDLNRAETSQLPVLFDQVNQLSTELQEGGMDLTSEIGLIESIEGQFRKKLPSYVRKMDGPKQVQQAREGRKISQDRWWWYADQIVATNRKNVATRWARNLGVLAVILVIAAVIYQRFFAPDPAFQASYGHQQQSENLLVQGDPETALQEVEAALSYTPDDPALYVLKGVIQDELDQPAEAAKSYQTALEKYEHKDKFYAQRAVLYLMSSQPELALADCDSALAINPDSAVSYLHMGQAYEMLGDISAAIESFETADEVARKIGNTQLQAIARVSLSQVMQRVTIPTLSDDETGLGE